MVYAIGFLNPSRQGLDIPKVDPHPRVTGLLPQYLVDFLEVLLIQPTGPPGTIAFYQPSQPLLIEMVHLIFDGPRCVTQPPRHLWTGHALCYQQDAVQAVIVAGLLGTLDILLQAQHGCSIGNPQWWSHDSRRAPFPPMRNYL